ncbi:MAG: immunoglobulin-like domain-containing protein [Bacilli bacterium]
MAKKTVKKVVKQIKKAPKKTKWILGLLSFLIIVGLVVAGLYYQNMAVSENDYVDAIVNDLKLTIPGQTSADLILPTSVDDYPNIEILWVSSNEAIISATGQVFRPLFTSGNKTISLTATFVIKQDDVMAQIAFSLLGIMPHQETFEVTVIKQEKTDLEKVQEALDSLFVPSQTVSSIGLPTQLAFDEEMVISWESADDAIIDSDGTVFGLGSTSLTATVSLGDVSLQEEFLIEVLSNFASIVFTNPNLEAISSGTYSEVWISNELTFNQAIIGEGSSEKVVRMKANLSATVTTTSLIHNPSLISFSYQLYATDADKINKANHIGVRYSSNNVDWTILSNDLINDALFHQVNIDLSALHDVYLQVFTTSEYLTDLRVDVSDLLIKRHVDASDVSAWLDGKVVKKTSTSLHFFNTTRWGGVVTWVSSDEGVVSHLGAITQPAETTMVTMTAQITGFPFAVSYQYDLQVNGYNTVEPLEIYFIDLGKYGQSDAGESIYFKVGNYDVLVDAGDDFQASNQAIQEVIDNNSEDQILDLVIATHPDADHIGGMSFVFSQYQVLNLLQFYGTHTTLLYQEYQSSYLAEGLISECLITDAMNNAHGCKKAIEIAPQVFIKLVETGYYETEETNGRSIVFILEAYGTKVLLTGDADNNDGRTVEANYQTQVGDIDILKAVHHATSNGSTLDFLNSANPETIIITNGNYFGNKHGHPTADAINRMYQANDETKIYAVVGGDVSDCEVTASESYECNVTDRFVDRNGTITISIDNNGYLVQAKYFASPLELSSTQFWENHPQKLYEYGG